MRVNLHGTAQRLRQWWGARRTPVLRVAVGLMTLLALLKLGDEFRRLLWESGRFGAIDLKHRYSEVHGWFAGEPVYVTHTQVLLPPASYPILWPLLGWVDLTVARWIWAVTTLAALGWLAYVIVRHSGADTLLERAFVALLLLSMNATGVTIGNGQLIIHLLAALLAAALLLERRQDAWRDDALVALLVCIALVKPSVSVPFCWLVVFIPRRLRSALLLTAGYGVLTMFAVSFQSASLRSLTHDWLARGVAEAAQAGYANLSIWMATLGLQQAMLPAALAALVALGIWVHRHRDADLWLLLGVTALVARFWIYHRLYDDLLVLLPMVALFRIAKRGPAAGDDADVTAGVLLAITLVSMWAPARMNLDRSPWVTFFNGGHTAIWLVVLVFLLDRARREKSAPNAE